MKIDDRPEKPYWWRHLFQLENARWFCHSVWQYILFL